MKSDLIRVFGFLSRIKPSLGIETEKRDPAGAGAIDEPVFSFESAE